MSKAEPNLKLTNPIVQGHFAENRVAHRPSLLIWVSYLDYETVDSAPSLRAGL
jgi:hypothetical protein